MTRRAAFALRVGLCSIAVFTTACVKQYEPPSASEPHAILKFRRRYQKTAGTDLVEVLRVDGRRAYRTTIPSMRATVPRTDALLVHPAEAEVEMFATFSHTETHTVQESYECGTTSSPRTCSRSVQRTTTITDGYCKQQRTVPFRPGSTYLLELDYLDPRHCSSHCMEQHPTGDGKFESHACPSVVQR